MSPADAAESPRVVDDVSRQQPARLERFQTEGNAPSCSDGRLFRRCGGDELETYNLSFPRWPAARGPSPRRVTTRETTTLLGLDPRHPCVSRVRDPDRDAAVQEEHKTGDAN